MDLISPYNNASDNFHLCPQRAHAKVQAQTDRVTEDSYQTIMGPDSSSWEKLAAQCQWFSKDQATRVDPVHRHLS